MPNAGKSTLYNSLLGDRLAIINPKAQTTRHRLIGIKNGEGYQVIYSDTPGVLKKISYKMHEKMMQFVHQSMADSDVLVLLLDINGTHFYDEVKLKFHQSDAKKILAINKIDTVTQEQLEARMPALQEEFKADAYVILSALNNFNTALLEKTILDFLPEHPPYFPEDAVTDRPERFFVNEIIRNQILNLYQDEIPYSAEVMTMAFKDTAKILRIAVEIIVEKESQKPIIIGTKGAMLKTLGIKARKDLEDFFGKQVFLETFVKTRKDWRNNDNMLKQFGYEE